METKTYLNDMRNMVDKALDDYLQPKAEVPKILNEAMRYSIFAGGKRFRSILCLAAYEIVGGNSLQAICPVACALECIHTYSLIHDDLPAVDNDDYRRGKLSNHKVYGDAIAIWAGDGLLTYAFELLSGMSQNNRNSPRIVCQIINEIADAAGISGILGGQVVDLQSEGKTSDEPTLEYIHRHKTAALIKVSVRAGALFGDADEVQLDALSIYGANLGLAFQIVDDLLDVIGDAKLLGKKTGHDAGQQKMTYLSLIGVEGARVLAKKKISIAKNVLTIFDKPELLKHLADFVVNRKH